MPYFTSQTYPRKPSRLVCPVRPCVALHRASASTYPVRKSVSLRVSWWTSEVRTREACSRSGSWIPGFPCTANGHTRSPCNHICVPLLKNKLTNSCGCHISLLAFSWGHFTNTVVLWCHYELKWHIVWPLSDTLFQVLKNENYSVISVNVHCQSLWMSIVTVRNVAAAR